MKKRFKFLLLLFILCTGIAFLLSSSLFQIKNIQVYGNKAVPKEEIVRLSNIYYGSNIFRINKRLSMKSIFQNPRIKLIKINRGIPDTITISVVEREVAALVPYVGSYLNIDEEGMIVEITGVTNKLKLPVIKGLKFDTFKVGDYLAIQNKHQLECTMNVIREIKNEGMVQQISEIDVTDIYNIKVTTKNGIKIALGSDNNTSYKIALAKAILTDAEKRKFRGTIDMSYQGNPVLKQE